MKNQEIRFNDVEPIHLGGGVVLFENAISFDSDWVVGFAEEQISKERASMYSPTTDPETGKPAYINKSGYLFGAEGIDSMPRRGSAIHRTEQKDVLDFLAFVEQSKDKYLLKYFVLFPLAYKNVWWKVKGHLVGYSTDHGGKYLGSHSDTSTNYSYGLPHPVDQLATRNTISTVVYFNDNFTGGHHYFNYLDIDYKPHTGDILMFPANYVAAHEIKPIEQGSRYSYLGWYCHGTPNTATNESVCDPLVQPELETISTNVYMPTLRQDLKDYLIKTNVDRGSHIFQLVENTNS
jgi:hypothetical protein